MMHEQLGDRWLQQDTWFRDVQQREAVTEVVHWRLADDRHEDECRYLLRFLWHLRVGYREVSYDELVAHVSASKMARLDRLFGLVASGDFAGIDDWSSSLASEVALAEDRTFHRNRLDSWLESLGEGVSGDPSLIASLPEDRVLAALGYLVSLACEAQNVANILLGRNTIAQIPLAWLVTRLPRVAEQDLDLTDSWECRRLLELYAMLNGELAQVFAARCAGTSDDEIAEVGNDFLADPSAFEHAVRKPSYDAIPDLEGKSPSEGSSLRGSSRRP